MVIDKDKLAKLVAAFRNPDPAYAGVAEAWRREQAKSPAERRAETEKLLNVAAQVEIGGGKYAAAAGWLRRYLAAELFASKVVDGTPFAV